MYQTIWFLVGPTSLNPQHSQEFNNMGVDFKILRGNIFITSNKRVTTNISIIQPLLEQLDNVKFQPRYIICNNSSECIGEDCMNDDELKTKDIFTYVDVYKNYKDLEQEDMCFQPRELALVTPYLKSYMYKNGIYYDLSMNPVKPIMTEEEIKEFNQKEIDECSRIRKNLRNDPKCKNSNLFLDFF